MEPAGLVVEPVNSSMVSEHLKKANALAELGVTGLVLDRNKREDRWLFSKALR
jgi:hypothetical protein